MLKNTLIQKIDFPLAKIQGISVAVLRLDQLHPVVSGNKLFKLKYYLETAMQQNKHHLITFGGPFSNHLVATAYAAREKGISTTGYVRGDATAQLTPTLEECISYGMELQFIERSQFQELQTTLTQEHHPHAIVVPYGGYGRLGAMGAKDILGLAAEHPFNYIMASCGSGTMAAGLLAALQPDQHLLLVSAVKNNFSIKEEIFSLLEPEEYLGKSVEINHDYHFGGFAKKNQQLLDFMNGLYQQTQLPTDVVYTGKLTYALYDLLKQNKIPARSTILLIHSGGLQGNRSLTNNELIF